MTKPELTNRLVQILQNGAARGTTGLAPTEAQCLELIDSMIEFGVTETAEAYDLRFSTLSGADPIPVLELIVSELAAR